MNVLINKHNFYFNLTNLIFLMIHKSHFDKNQSEYQINKLIIILSLFKIIKVYNIICIINEFLILNDIFIFYYNEIPNNSLILLITKL